MAHEPRVVAGTLAGAQVGSLYATGCDPQWIWKALNWHPCGISPPGGGNLWHALILQSWALLLFAAAQALVIALTLLAAHRDLLAASAAIWERVTTFISRRIAAGE